MAIELVRYYNEKGCEKLGEGGAILDRYFRLYLTGVLISFTLIFSIAIGVFDYNKGQKQIRLNHEKEIKIIGDTVVQSLYTIDGVYRLTDNYLNSQMEEGFQVLLDLYETEPNIFKWDYEHLYDQLNMDVYVIDDTNTVVTSSLELDIGLNFRECCGSFADVIEKKRLSGQLSHEGIDVQQSTGEIKKFAYLPTPDRKYLLELSMLIDMEAVFGQFNFLKEIERLEKEYKPVQSIQVYNATGVVLGYTNPEGRSKRISEEFRPAFNKAKQNNVETMMVAKVGNENLTHRYIPYVMEQDDYSIKRVVEIVYSEAELDSLLKFYRDGFFYQQLIILLAVILLATIIGKIVEKPIHYAFHDSLTGLKNRAAFEMEGTRRLKKNYERVALIMIDIDNFKIVNDKLGHIEGDMLLVDIAQNIKENTKAKSTIARIGGDEFVILCANQEKETLEKLADTLITTLNEAYRTLNEEHHLNVSISIGIAEALENEDLKSLYDRADKALYMAKENGKNQYKIWTNEGVQQV